MQFGSVAGAAGGEAAGRDLGYAARGPRGRGGCRGLRRFGRGDRRGRDRAFAVNGEDFDPLGEGVFGGAGVVPGEVEVIAAAVAGVAVVADPAEGGTGLVLDRLGPVGEAGDRRPGGIAPAVATQRHEVDGESVVVVGAADVAAV